MQNQPDEFLHTPSIKEDWGGDGRGRMNLSGRRTAISKEYLPRQYQFFDTNAVQQECKWRINGIPEEVISGRRRLLTWHDECGASTSRVVLPTQFEAPSGIFTADLEIFVLKGAIQVGEWRLSKHGYSFIPAGVKFGPWKVLGDEEVEILWMENGFLKYRNAENNHPNANLSDFIPALDSKLLAWGKTETVQFVQANKKWLRKDSNGGGVWLLAILPHYESKYPEIQCYNEEGYCLAGYCDVGDYRFLKDHFLYCPSFSTIPKHRTDDGCLFLIRVDRDLSKVSTVLSYAPGDT
ncbi:hypothetical protein CBP27_15600 [Fischerella thermalis WC542]|jgi:hypothetical protein|uniref:DUF4437 domain-containing protein n=1 Tax=Fischerella thermalis TaxID=372787 RepID=UPI00035F8921|nr:DUF4437 domain-containing protein [Fischerella thermalis]PLZ27194.1 hypothetical protein CBP28_13260 [Fischerella thermalis WC559]PLZ29590.1 hypothetical protein CBP10_15090 [Fischerella thermalis WC558]PLZ34466.1 hypothetical protein CBP27_15600 [Fischerella thermalis WC542]PLZ57237.1 hypothetical protein CBP15_05410 [Fischerella thermalis WC442]PLZ62045.1 hypothetical protein CBP24_02750 [Fischerella thermalis WC439]